MFRTKEYISFSDCDPAGIMFFSRAFEKAHTCYEKFLFKNGLGSYFSTADVIIPILNAESSFRKPMYAGEEIIVSLKLLEMRENSFSLSYTITDQSGETAVLLKIVHLCAKKESFVKCNIPENLRNALTGLSN